MGKAGSRTSSSVGRARPSGLVGRVAALDFETFLPRPGRPCPIAVCLAEHSGPERSGLYSTERAPGRLEALLGGDDSLVFHNAGFDLSVICFNWPDLIPLVCWALDGGRIHDTQIREGLISLGTVGEVQAEAGMGPLSDLARKWCGIDVSPLKEGDDVWRKHYAELAEVPIEQWPDGARDYALMDARLTWEVFRAQEEHADLLRSEWLHVSATFCGGIRQFSGIAVDREVKEALQTRVLAELSPEALPLVFESGLVSAAIPARPGKVKRHADGCPRRNCACPAKLLAPVEERLNVKEVLEPRISAAWKALGREPRRGEVTPTMASKGVQEGNLVRDSEVVELLAPFDPVLAQFERRQELVKLRDSYFPALEWPYGSGVTAERIHPRTDPLKNTGRISVQGNTKRNADSAMLPASSVQQADPRMRSCFRPSEGFVFAIGDYSAIDLCALAQTMHDLFGESPLLDQINAGIDPHAFLATALTFETDHEFRGEAGGLSDEEALARFAARPKEWRGPKRDLAKKVGLGFGGGMGIERMRSLCRRELKLDLTEEQAEAFRTIWFRVYPPHRRYLKRWVPAQTDATGERLRYESRLGMVRVGCSYTECANGRALQTPAAEGMKVADFLVTRACVDPSIGDVLLGCRPVLQVHDELVIEVPDDSRADERAQRLGALMVEGMRQSLPDVVIKVKLLLARRWVKDAEPVYDDEGRLVPWEPTTE